MKQSSDWTEEDLIALVNNGVQESLLLEYKECRALKKEDQCRANVSKDVSSFANSAGGTLVYGIVENNQTHFPEKVDDGFDPTDISHEWLEQVINGSIQPKIENLIINPVHLSNNKMAYVVIVPQSNTAHQSSDKKYYKRYNFQSIPMEDYEIRDIINRKKYPILTPQFTYKSINLSEKHTYKLRIILLNEGAIRVNHLKLIFNFPKVLLDPGTLSGDATHIVTNNSEIIFPGDMWSPEPDGFLKYEVDRHRHNVICRDNLYLSWKLFADDMPFREGKKYISELNQF